MEKLTSAKTEGWFAAGYTVLILLPLVLIAVYLYWPPKLDPIIDARADEMLACLACAVVMVCVLGIRRLPWWLRLGVGLAYACLVMGPVLQLYGSWASAAAWR